MKQRVKGYTVRRNGKLVRVKGYTRDKPRHTKRKTKRRKRR